MVGQVSEQSREILELFASGHNHDQVMSVLPTVTYLDICQAMQEALDRLGQLEGQDQRTKPTFAEHLEKIRAERPNAWGAWTHEQEQQLKKLRGERVPLEEIARRMDRTKGAIMARLIRMEEQGELPE
jgi:hypothetical protein